MQTPEEVAREVLRGRRPSHAGGPIDPEQVALLEAWAAEVRAEALAGFTEWFAPAYTAPNGNTCPLGPGAIDREYAESDARVWASPEDETPVYVARRLVGPWEPES